MDLTVIGAGPAYSDRPGSTGAAYLVRDGDAALLLDLGQGSFPGLASRIEPSSLLAVVISHLHADHLVDLVPLRHYLRYQTDGRRVRVLGPTRLTDRLDGVWGEPGFIAASLDIEPLGLEERTFGPFRLATTLVEHTDESYAIRISTDAGPGLVYSGDCGRADDLRPLIHPGDALLTEVSFGAEPVPDGAFHLNGPAVGGLAAATGVGRVLLTHLQMGFDREATVDSVRARFDGPVELVDPGFETSI